MGEQTKIEFCDSSLNLVMGCDGCELFHRHPERNHCYAYRTCRRYAGRKGWPADFHKPETFMYRLDLLHRWKDLTNTNREGKPWLDGLPRFVFLNDLGDGFCPSVDPSAWYNLDTVEVMAKCPHFLLSLTKWPLRMIEFLDTNPWPDPWNMAFGTTVTGPETLYRVTDLLAHYLEVAVIWISAEPLLAPIDLDAACRDALGKNLPDVVKMLQDNRQQLWITAGGESGSNARPSHPDSFRRLRDQCLEAGALFFLKQWGEFIPCEVRADPRYAGGRMFSVPGGGGMAAAPGDRKGYRWLSDDLVAYKCGREAAGRLLDGEEWTQVPVLIW